MSNNNNHSNEDNYLHDNDSTQTTSDTELDSLGDEKPKRSTKTASVKRNTLTSSSVDVTKNATTVKFKKVATEQSVRLPARKGKKARKIAKSVLSKAKRGVSKMFEVPRKVVTLSNGKRPRSITARDHGSADLEVEWAVPTKKTTLMTESDSQTTSDYIDDSDSDIPELVDPLSEIEENNNNAKNQSDYTPGEAPGSDGYSTPVDDDVEEDKKIGWYQAQKRHWRRMPADVREVVINDLLEEIAALGTISIPHYLTNKERNRLMHAMNGNTEEVVLDAVVPVDTTDVLFEVPPAGGRTLEMGPVDPEDTWNFQPAHLSNLVDRTRSYTQKDLEQMQAQIDRADALVDIASTLGGYLPSWVVDTVSKVWDEAQERAKQQAPAFGPPLKVQENAGGLVTLQDSGNVAALSEFALGLINLIKDAPATSLEVAKDIVTGPGVQLAIAGKDAALASPELIASVVNYVSPMISSAAEKVARAYTDDNARAAVNIALPLVFGSNAGMAVAALETIKKVYGPQLEAGVAADLKDTILEEHAPYLKEHPGLLPYINATLPTATGAPATIAQVETLLKDSPPEKVKQVTDAMRAFERDFTSRPRSSHIYKNGGSIGGNFTHYTGKDWIDADLNYLTRLATHNTRSGLAREAARVVRRSMNPYPTDYAAKQNAKNRKRLEILKKLKTTFGPVDINPDTIREFVRAVEAQSHNAEMHALNGNGSVNNMIPTESPEQNLGQTEAQKSMMNNIPSNDGYEMATKVLTPVERLGNVYTPEQLKIMENSVRGEIAVGRDRLDITSTPGSLLMTAWKAIAQWLNATKCGPWVTTPSLQNMFFTWAEMQPPCMYQIGEAGYTSYDTLVESVFPVLSVFCAEDETTVPIPVAKFHQLYLSMFKLVTASNSKSVAMQLSPALTAYNSSLQTGVNFTSSSIMRLNNDMVNGVSVAKALNSDINNKLYSGMCGSAACILYKALMYMQQVTPLPGSEIPMTNVRMKISNPYDFRPYGANELVTRTSSEVIFPLDPNITLAATNAIYAGVISLNQMASIQYNTSKINDTGNPNVWTYATFEKWGSTCALVPVTAEMQGAPDELAMWIACYLEYPFKAMGWKVNLCNDDGTNVSVTPGLAGFTSTPYFPTVAAVTRMPGIQQGVLLVTVEDVDSALSGISWVIGATNSIAVNATTNNAVTTQTVANIYAPLAALLGDVPRMQRALPTVLRWWRELFGSAEDWSTACMLAADASYIPTQMATYSTYNDDPTAYTEGVAGGWTNVRVQTSPNVDDNMGYKPAHWMTSALDDVFADISTASELMYDALTGDNKDLRTFGTSPLTLWYLSREQMQATYPDTDMYRVPTATMGAYDQTMGIYTAAGYVVAAKKIPSNFSTDCQTMCYKLRNIGAYLTTLTDATIQAYGVPYEELVVPASYPLNTVGPSASAVRAIWNDINKTLSQNLRALGATGLSINIQPQLAGADLWRNLNVDVLNQHFTSWSRKSFNGYTMWGGKPITFDSAYVASVSNESLTTYRDGANAYKVEKTTINVPESLSEDYWRFSVATTITENVITRRHSIAYSKSSWPSIAQHFAVKLRSPSFQIGTYLTLNEYSAAYNQFNAYSAINMISPLPYQSLLDRTDLVLAYGATERILILTKQYRTGQLITTTKYTPSDVDIDANAGTETYLSRGRKGVLSLPSS